MSLLLPQIGGINITFAAFRQHPSHKNIDQYSGNGGDIISKPIPVQIINNE
jgi:hypothetical protein